MIGLTTELNAQPLKLVEQLVASAKAVWNWLAQDQPDATVSYGMNDIEYELHIRQHEAWVARMNAKIHKLDELVVTYARR